MKKVLLIVLMLGVVLMAGCSGKPNPQVTIEMENGGKIVLELYPDKAPNTVNNFLSLANSGFYDGTVFHRIMSDFMIQGGSPTGTGIGGPGYTIPGEMPNNGYDANDLSHVRGIISMGRVGHDYDSAGSQFFIVVRNSTFLDREYAAFGRVIEGMDVVDEIRNVEVTLDDSGREMSVPVNPPIIRTMTTETFGVRYSEPRTVN
jgi:peptidyl-prolyl cis-trans isomerase B (cyclophilin B)